MHYQKITAGDTIIEFHNNWLGQETVIVNGQIVSQKTSIGGTTHYFNVRERGRNVRYALTTRIDGIMQVVLDLSRYGRMLEKGIPVRLGVGMRRQRESYTEFDRKQE
ncbi:MAG: hypothetical protein AAFQ37_05085, partial [Bacteroidota bacterium]